MHRLNFIVPISLALMAMHCVKKQFVAFEKPHSVMHIRQNSRVEILQEPLKKEMIDWDSEKLVETPVEGLLRVTYKNTDYFYLQMNCPPQLKCNGKKVYIPRNLTHAPDAGSLPFKSEYKEPPADASAARFVLAEAQQIKDLIATRNWHGDAVKRDIPVKFDRVIFGASLPAQNQITIYGNLVYLARSVIQNDYPEKPSSDFISNFPIYAEIVKSKGANLNDAQKKFLRDLYSGIEADYSKLLRKEIEEFPFENASYSAMATAFNRISAPQMLRAELVNKIAKNSSFVIKEPAAAAMPVVVPGGAALYAQEASTAAAPETVPVKVQTATSLSAGVIFEYNLAGKAVKTPVAENEIVAFAHEKGLGFQLGKDKNQAILLEPAEESLFLKSGNKAEIQKFIKEIPDSKKIIADYDFDLALLRIAMRYGKGELNRQTGLFEYEIELSKGQNFWIVLGAIKHYFGTDDEDTYSAEIPSHKNPLAEVSESTKGQINWYQKYEKEGKRASMGIKGKATYCQRSCYDAAVDMVCLKNEEYLRVVFRPSALMATNGDKDSRRISENVRADFLNKDQDRYETCNRFLRIGRTDEKFE